MDILDLYEQWARTYDRQRNLTRDLDRSVSREILSRFHFRVILEFGCGTGKNTSLLGRIGDKVLAMDFSPAMIRRARAKRNSADIFFAVADIARPWPCPDASVDLITVNLVLEHVHDLNAVFAEASRCLVPGGRLFICELHPFRQYRGVKAHFQTGGATVQIPAFTHHISDFLATAQRCRLILENFREWRHAEDQGGLPRLVSFMFEKRSKVMAIRPIRPSSDSTGRRRRRKPSSSRPPATT